MAPVERGGGGGAERGAQARLERGIVVADAGVVALDALWNEVKLAE